MSGLDDAIHECSTYEDLLPTKPKDDNPPWWAGYKALAAQREKQPKRRWKGYRLGFDTLQIMFGAALFQINGIPQDARIVGVHQDFERYSILFVVEHESFPPLEPDDLIMYEKLKVGYVWPKEAI